jgi:hypothetical protein
MQTANCYREVGAAGVNSPIWYMNFILERVKYIIPLTALLNGNAVDRYVAHTVYSQI